jgi:phosphate transport system substrate-binding protein
MVNGKLVDNPHTQWADFNSDLPAVDILAFIPGTKHGTREVFEEKVIAVGCEETGAMAAMISGGMSEDDAEDACLEVRTDGRLVDIDGDYTETLASIDANGNAIGVFGLAFYENNTDKLKVATMAGVVPSTETIAKGDYPVSRPLYFYVKKAHIGVIPGLKEYAQFFVADELAGPDGPLAQYGLVSDPELATTQATVENEETMQ